MNLTDVGHITGYANCADVFPVYIGDDRTDEDAFKVLEIPHVYMYICHYYYILWSNELFLELGVKREGTRVRNSCFKDSERNKCFVFVGRTIGGYGILEAIGRLETNVIKTNQKTSARDQNVST